LLLLGCFDGRVKDGGPVAGLGVSSGIPVCGKKYIVFKENFALFGWGD